MSLKESSIQPIEAHKIQHSLFGPLYDVDTWESNGRAVPEYCNFRWSSGAIRELLAEQREVPMLEEEEIVTFHKYMESLRMNPDNADISEVVGEQIQAELEAQMVGERSRTSYMIQGTDFSNYFVGFTPINFGQSKSVHWGLSKNDQHRPMLTYHTHPENTLFSTPDYVPLITDFESYYSMPGRKRLLCGTLVLCPDVQVLALASKDTPVLPDRAAGAYMRNISDEIYTQHMDEMQSRFGTEIPEIKRLELQFIKSHKSELLNVMTQLRSQMNARIITHGELTRKVEEFIMNKDETGNKCITERRRIGKIEKDTWNKYLFDVAKRLNIRLYLSNNLEDFYLQPI